MRKYCQCEYVVCQGVPILEIKYLWSANEKALDPMNPKFDNETLFSLKFADTKLIGTRIRKSGVQEVVRIDMCPIRYLSFGDNVHLVNDCGEILVRDVKRLVIEFSISHAFRMIATLSGTDGMVPNTNDSAVYAFECAVAEELLKQ